MLRAVVKRRDALLLGLAVVLGTAFVASCSSSSNDEEDAPPTCDTWQDAMCEFGVRCDAVSSRADCDDTYQSIQCKSEEVALACLDELLGATCSTPIPSCTLERVADPAPAFAACNTFITEICKVQVGCDATLTQTDCEAQVALDLDCASAIGVDPDFSACLDAVRGMQCSTAELPEVCVGAIKLGA
jgi:hypothetical protein